jgi:hypothetical protein
MTAARRDTLLALGLLTLAFAATLWMPPFDDERVNDLYVYRVFAEPVLDGRLPYREVFFEYPPLAAPAIALPGIFGTGADEFRWAFAGWTFLLAVAVLLLGGALAARTGGDRRRALLALALTPLLVGAMIRTHFDLAPVGLLLAALLLLCGGRPRLGLALIGLGAMTKGFPLVVAPVALAWLVGRGQRRAALEGALALVAVLAVVALAAVAISPRGALDAVEYHTERPIQVESTAAVVLRGLDGLGLGELARDWSHRSDNLTHPADGAVTAVLTLTLLAVLALLAAAASRSRPAEGNAAPPAEARRLVLASLAAVLAFAALGKVLSPQYLLWIAPFGALALAWRLHALAAVVALACVLTQIEFPARYFDLLTFEPFPVAVVVLRDLTLLAALALCLRALLPSPLSSPAAAAARSA